MMCVYVRDLTNFKAERSKDKENFETKAREQELQEEISWKVVKNPFHLDNVPRFIVFC